MDCPFCGVEMAPGRVAVRGAWPMAAWDAALTWQPDAAGAATRRRLGLGTRGQVILLIGRLFRRRERAAALCYACGAVVLDPFRSASAAARPPDVVGRTGA
jgi:hypothetical protein